MPQNSWLHVFTQESPTESRYPQLEGAWALFRKLLAEQQPLHRQLIVHFLAQPVGDLGFGCDLDAGFLVFREECQDVSAETRVGAPWNDPSGRIAEMNVPH